MSNSVSGAYRLQVYDGEELVTDTGEFTNVITDYAVTTDTPFSSGLMCVGSGNSTPAKYQTALDAELAAQSCSFSQTGTLVTRGESLYAKRTVYAEFTGIEGDIREVGFRGTGAGALISRSLVRDGNGLATRIPIVASQTLKVSYSVYVLIPESLDSGVITTPYGSANYDVKPSDAMTQAKGFLSGSFSTPFNGVGLIADLDGGSTVAATVFDWSYDAATQTATATVNFEAVEGNRSFIGFKAASDSDSFLQISLSAPLLNPENNDFSFTLSLSWSRG